MESLVRDEVTEYVTKSNMLTKHQHGFVQQRSCLTNLLETLEARTEAIDNLIGLDKFYYDGWNSFQHQEHCMLKSEEASQNGYVS